MLAAQAHFIVCVPLQFAPGTRQDRLASLQAAQAHFIVCVPLQFAPGTRHDRLASLQAAKPQQSKPQQPTSRTKGAAIQMSPSEALSLYLCPEASPSASCHPSTSHIHTCPSASACS